MMNNTLFLLSMESWWANLEGTEQVFWGIAIIFSVLFTFQFVLSLFGLDTDVDADFGEIPEDVDGVGGDYSIDPSFTVFSIRSVIAFFTFFGWMGVYLISQDTSMPVTVFGASIAGLSAMFVVAYMLFLFGKLTKAGNVNINEALYKTAEVYLTIPPDKMGKGKIHFQLGKSLREMDAITENFMAIPTGATVKIVEVLDDEVLMVEPYS